MVNIYELVPPPTPHALAHRSFCALESFPIPVITVSQDLKDLTKRRFGGLDLLGKCVARASFLLISHKKKGKKERKKERTPNTNPNV